MENNINTTIVHHLIDWMHVEILKKMSEPEYLDVDPDRDREVMQSTWVAYHRCFSYVDNLMNRLYPEKNTVPKQTEEAAQNLVIACTMENLIENSFAPFKSQCVDPIKVKEHDNELIDSDYLVDNPNQITRLTEQELIAKGNFVKNCIKSDRKYEGSVYLSNRYYFHWRKPGSAAFFFPRLIENFTTDRNKFRSYEFKGNEETEEVDYKLDFITERFAKKELREYFVCMTSNSPAMSDKFDTTDMKLNCLPERLSYHFNVDSVFCRKLYERCLRRRDAYMYSQDSSYPRHMNMQDRTLNEFTECQLYDTDIAKACVLTVEDYINRKGAQGAAQEALNETIKQAAEGKTYAEE